MTHEDVKRMIGERLSSFVVGAGDQNLSIRAVEDQFRRAFPDSEVSVKIDEDTEDEAVIREVLEEPKDSTVLVTVRMPVVLDRISLVVTTSGDENGGDDGNDGNDG